MACSFTHSRRRRASSSSTASAAAERHGCSVGWNSNGTSRLPCASYGWVLYDRRFEAGGGSTARQGAKAAAPVANAAEETARPRRRLEAILVPAALEH